MPSSSERSRLVRHDVGGEGEADEGSARHGRLPAIDTHERGGRDVIARLLQRFAHRGGDQSLSGFEVASRLVQPHAGPRLLLDQQERAVADHDGGHGGDGTRLVELGHLGFPSRPAATRSLASRSVYDKKAGTNPASLHERCEAGQRPAPPRFAYFFGAAAGACVRAPSRVRRQVRQRQPAPSRAAAAFLSAAILSAAAFLSAAFLSPCPRPSCRQRPSCPQPSCPLPAVTWRAQPSQERRPEREPPPEQLRRPGPPPWRAPPEREPGRRRSPQMRQRSLQRKACSFRIPSVVWFWFAKLWC